MLGNAEISERRLRAPNLLLMLAEGRCSISQSAFMTPQT